MEREGDREIKTEKETGTEKGRQTDGWSGVEGENKEMTRKDFAALSKECKGGKTMHSSCEQNLG